jgi:hypothetical protein
VRLAEPGDGADVKSRDPAQAIVISSYAAGRSRGAETDFSHARHASTESYGVDVPAMSLERREWDIHIV